MTDDPKNPDDNRKQLIYTGIHLDRAGLMRRDEAWLAGSLASEGARIVAVWRNRSLVAHGDDGPRALMPEGGRAADLIAAASNLVFLGLDPNQVPYFGADLSHLDEHDAIELASTGAGESGSFVDLRQLGWLIPRNDAGVLAYARGLAYWHRTHGFCGRCGSATESRDGGHMRQCTNTECARPSFPRTDPAVIMLVEHPGDAETPPSCLLGRSGRWEFPLYSTLAGFVEPGESLEEAVAREVLEETNIQVAVRDVHYMGSQPWPFPASLMLGFRATARSREITIDPKELEDARWFTVEEVSRFKEWDTAASDEPRLPRRDSIARWLVQSWLEDV
jgi:NAD+ diphosphatase